MSAPSILQLHLGGKNPTLEAVAGVVLAPVAAFFNVPVFVALLAFVAIDFATGIYKAHVLRRICSQHFGSAAERAMVYAAVFATLHLISLVAPAPYDALSRLMEGAVMTAMLVKEGISILENVKITAHARGIETPVLDLLIDKLGLDFERMLGELRERDFLQEARSHTPATDGGKGQ